MLRYSNKIWILLATVYHFILIVLSLLPTSVILPPGGEWPTATQLNNFDLLEHFIAYFILTTLWQRVLSTSLESISIAVATGGLLEIVQYTIPWRSFSIWDFLASAAGAVIAAIIFRRRLVSSLLPHA